MKYESKIARTRFPLDESELDDFGWKGWKLVGIIKEKVRIDETQAIEYGELGTTVNGFWYYFIREIKEQK